MVDSEQQENGMSVFGTVFRSMFGGALMGLANLVPGISGGTMLLASGIYTSFIDAIVEITTLRIKLKSILVLGSVVVAAGLVILLLAGTVKGLVVDHRWIMYSIFIGLTIGGVPIIWRMIGKATRSVWTGSLCGFVAMSVLAWVQQMQLGTSESGAAGIVMLFVAGIAGASAMILPGVSGGYLLLVLGQYVPILSAIDSLKEALSASEWGTVISIGLRVVMPVGIGVVVGVVGVSNLIRVCLKRFEKATLGVLLGLLLGAVVGLWPFQQGVAPEIGTTVKGQVVTALSLTELDPEDYPTSFFRPTAGQSGGAFGFIIAGFLVTLAISRLGGKED